MNKPDKQRNDRTHAEFLHQLHQNWSLYKEQALIAHSILVKRNRLTVVNCGRKFGKSFLGAYIIWRWAMENPGSFILYVAPTKEQAKNIIWDAPDVNLKSFGPADYIKRISETEKSITFKNGSIIKLMYSNANPESLRGLRPHMCVYDELRDFNPDFFLHMTPNYSVHDTKIMTISTPPPLEDIENGKCKFYTDFMDEAKEKTDCAYFEYPTWTNPYLSRDYLDMEKKRLYEAGLEHEWMREYEAQIVAGSDTGVFPGDLVMNAPNGDRGQILKILKQRPSEDFEWFVAIDPGSTSCFAVLFGVIDLKTTEVYCLDAIYEKNKYETSTHKIWQRVEKKIEELGAHKDWWYFYDSAAAWFANEVQDRFPEAPALIPINKNTRGKSRLEGLVLIKDLLLERKLIFSNDTTDLINEMTALKYKDHKEGTIGEDHLIDALRYGLYGTDYTTRIKKDMPTFEHLEQEEKLAHPMNKLSAAQFLEYIEKQNKKISQYTDFPNWWQ